ncbi:hypothetical protein ACHAW5_010419 [Stephanodiscus triporus]|uniref:Acyltransferase n=1 Tax=Stephanodiscus triporus TaxID=2934178 RepID=A0ABD3PBC9_9STRA
MCKKVDPPPPPPADRRRRPVSVCWYLLGMAVASTFSLAYLLVPIYLLTAIFALASRHPNALVYSIPIFVSMFVPPKFSRRALTLARPMLDYFDFESLHLSNDDDNDNDDGNRGGRRGRILAAQPHGVLTFVAMCEAVTNPESAMRTPTAVASVLLRTPILRNLMGIFNLVDASGRSLKRHLLDGDGDGDGGEGGGSSVLLYVGGIAELFKSCRDEERLYLRERKGFIKLALTSNVDVVPVYLFGNTSVLSVLRRGPLAGLSRWTGASLTLFWGKFYLPIPRDEKLLYVVGRPIGLPHIAHPTQEDIDKWHGVYCDEVRDIYETYKERVPMYKRKKLYID